jgi:hypothetical protein
LSNNSVTLYMEGKAKWRNMFANISYKDVGQFEMTHSLHYNTKDVSTFSLSKMVFLMISDFETKDKLYKVVCEGLESYQKAYSIYHSILYSINNQRDALEKRVYQELRRQLIESFEVGDVYELHKGNVEVVELNEKHITCILLDENSDTKFEDLKVNVAHQILEKAPKRKKKIAEVFINSTGFKKQHVRRRT